MKKSLFFAIAATVLAGCASDELVDVSVPNSGSSHSDIRFTTNQKNITRAQALNKAGHYNFGVFAYKSTDKVNNIMADYLVGYHDDANAYSTSGTTVGDTPGQVDGSSQWMYEGLGYGEFTGTFAGQRLNPGEKYASNVENQYLRYWDNAADYTTFYAYAPYVNGGSASVVKYVDGQEVGTSTDKYVMTIPNGTIKHGYDKADELEFMYAWAKVAKADYGHDVALNFNRLNAKVNIKFWEDIPGYSVRIIDLNSSYSVSAVPSIHDTSSGKYGYKLGKIYSENGAKIQFDTENASPAAPVLKQYEGTTVSTPIKFAAPTAAQIGESRLDATPSTTTYYAIPKGSADGVLSNTADKLTDAGTLNTDLALTGLTFHVSYELISTTGEVITVKDATVFVPTDYTNWKANTHYTYIFKITKNSNGSTSSDVTVKPEDPEVPTEPSLYPIIFDNCTVVDWDENESEHVISDALTLSYHNITLDKYSVTDGAATDITVTIADGDKSLAHPVDYTAVAVTGPADASTWYNSGTKKISVPAGAAAGVYTVTYTCPSGDIYTNHPKTWTAQFVVGNAYTVTTNLPAVGTHALAATALRISATKDASSVAPSAAELAIEYPVNVDNSKVKVSADGSKIEVAQDATPGKYKLVYTITVDAAKVKVAEKVFDVVDYQPALTHAIVYLEGSSVIVKLGRTGGDEAIWVDNDFCTNHATSCDGVGAKITCGASGSDMTITVANDTPEGVRTVYYVVNQSDADSKSMYQCMFNVQNTYTVALSKNTLNTTVGAANAAEYGSDYIEITSTKNGVADALSAETAAKYKVDGLDAANYTIVYVPVAAAVPYADAAEYNAAKSTSLTDDEFAALSEAEKTKTPAVVAHIKLQVKKSVPAGNYKVVYTGQTTPDTKTAEAAFVIQK